MSVLASSTVGQLVAERPGRSRVFEALGIDFCCGGKVPLGQACRALGLDVETTIRAIEREDSLGPGDPDASDVSGLTASELADHIEQRHHAFLRVELPRLERLAEHVARAHGVRDPRLTEVRQVFGAFAHDMFAHMLKEERVLFPMIRAMEQGQSVACNGGTVANPIRQMEAEHEGSGAALARLRDLTDGFTPPESACNSHRALLDGLAALERDTHRHVHTENHMLFPRAVALESAAAMKRRGHDAAGR